MIIKYCEAKPLNFHSLMSQTQELNQKNLANLEGTLGICPRTGQKTVLIEALLVKSSWGGKETMAGNIVNMSPGADFEYYMYAKKHPKFGVMLEAKKEAKVSTAKEIYDDFLTSPKMTLSGDELLVKILKNLTRVRIQLMLDRMRDEARFRKMSAELDPIYPMTDSRILKKADEFFPEDKEQTWQNLFMGISADARTKMQLIEKEIENVLEYSPVWTKYLKKVTGIGPWFAGYLIATIGNPKRFSETAKLWGLAGLRVDKFGKSQKAKTPFWKQQNLLKEEIEILKQICELKGRSMDALDYDPILKQTLAEILPVGMIKMKGMMEKKGNADSSPYNALIDSIRAKEQQKALEAQPAKCLYCGSTNIVNLGIKEREVVKKKSDDGEEKNSTEIPKKYFAGFCCQETLGKATEHKFFNPAHIQRRVQRELGKKIIADIYHAMLYFAGENPRIFGGTFADGHIFAGNERLMFYLKK